MFTSCPFRFHHRHSCVPSGLWVALLLTLSVCCVYTAFDDEFSSNCAYYHWRLCSATFCLPSMRPLFRALSENRNVVVAFVIALLTFFFVFLLLHFLSRRSSGETIIIAPTIDAPGAPKKKGNKSKGKHKTMETIKKRLFCQPNVGRVLVHDLLTDNAS